MYAMKVMTRPVVTVPADATVWAAADILLGARISAAPVVDADGRMIGIVSEADLMSRPETGTVPGRSWLQRLLADEAVLARDYMRSHSHHVADVMTRNVVAAEERTELKEIARLMQRHGIKRVPIVRDGKVVGIVSRANLLQGLLAREPRAAEGTAPDETVRTRVSERVGQALLGFRRQQRRCRERRRPPVGSRYLGVGQGCRQGGRRERFRREAGANKIVVLPVEPFLPADHDQRSNPWP